MASRQDKKNEAILQGLLKLKENKRCIDCDTQGPTYAVMSGFNVFVCTICSGHHRTFGHRVKGVSMSTFKQEEVQALQEGGNGRFSAFFLAKWSSSALPKPSDRESTRVLDWIQQVFEAKRFYGEPEEGYAPPALPAAAVLPALAIAAPTSSSGTTSEGREVVVVKSMADVLGSETPKLMVGARAPSLDRTTSKASTASAGVADSSAASRAVPNLLDVSSPSGPSTAASLAATPPRAAAWDPFGGTPEPAAPLARPAAVAPAAAASQEAAWATFGEADIPSPKRPVPPPAQVLPAKSAAPTGAPAAAATPGSTAAVPADNGWEAFGDTPAPARPVPPPATAVRPAAALATSSSLQPASPAIQQAVPAPSPKQQSPKPPARPEVPLDVFYPEFERIRATGMLPNGQPVPRPLYYAPPGQPAATYAMQAQPQPAYGMNGTAQQYGNYSYAPQQPQPYGYPTAQTAATPYGAAASPGAAARPGMLTIPGGPAGYGGPTPATYGAPSPATAYSGFSPAAYGAPSPGSHFGAPSPATYSPASGYSPNGITSPAGSNFSSAAGHVNGMAALYGSVRSSSSSLHDPVGSSSAASAPTCSAAAAASINDPFSSLTTGLRSSLPAVHAAPAPAVPSPPRPGPAPGSLYDLTAPAAPKPKPSGNPFG